MTRANFSKETQRAAIERSKRKGIPTCECHRLHAAGVPGFEAQGCGRPLGIANTFFEHIDPDALSKDNSLDNAAVLVKTCWKRKTDTYDKRVIAKSTRVRDKAMGIENPWKHKLPGGKTDTRKKKIAGPVVHRYTGVPL